MTSFVQMILQFLVSFLYFRLLGNRSNAYTPPSFPFLGHGLRQNLHVDQGRNGLLLGVFQCSSQLFHGLYAVSLAAVSFCYASVVDVHCRTEIAAIVRSAGC